MPTTKNAPNTAKATTTIDTTGDNVSPRQMFVEFIDAVSQIDGIDLNADDKAQRELLNKDLAPAAVSYFSMAFGLLKSAKRFGSSEAAPQNDLLIAGGVNLADLQTTVDRLGEYLVTHGRHFTLPKACGEGFGGSNVDAVISGIIGTKADSKQQKNFYANSVRGFNG